MLVDKKHVRVMKREKTGPWGSQLLSPDVRRQKRKQWTDKRNLDLPYISLRNTANRIRRRGDECFVTGAYLITLWKQQEGRCAMSGVRMTWGEGGLKLTSVSVDRIVPERGYVTGNVRLVCFGLNSLKNSATDAEALALATAFVAHQRRS